MTPSEIEPETCIHMSKDKFVLVQAIKVHSVSGVIAPIILNLGTKWR
jgi:hypothetical protein